LDTLLKRRDTNAMIPKIKKMYISRDVTFLEDEPYYKNIDKEMQSSNDFTLPLKTNPSIETRIVDHEEDTSEGENIAQEEL
jgi:hypothetical protein